MSAARILVATTLGIVLIAPSVFAGNLEQKGGQQAVKVEQLPPTVTAAVEKMYPKSTIVSAASINRGGQTGYQLSVKTATDEKPVAVMVSVDGQIRTGAKAAPPAAARKGARQGAAPPPVQGETVAVINFRKPSCRRSPRRIRRTSSSTPCASRPVLSCSTN